MASLALAFDITANDQGAAKTFKDVGESAEDAGKKGEGFGSSLKKGFGIAAGAIAAAGLGAAFTSFISEAAESAKIARLTGSVIESTGGKANVTAEQVSELAGALSKKTAADDAVIQSGANMLLTFTNVRNEVGKGNDIFDQATATALDMSVALGTDIKGASIQLGKALNDPIAGVSALAEAGVTFTDQQKDQIKVMVESGNILDAQKMILNELGTEFGGAAEAAAGPLDHLKTAAGEMTESLGAVALPAVEGLASFIGDTLIPVGTQLFDVLFKGDFTGGPLSEDSKVIDAAFRLRDGIMGAKDGAQQLYDVLFRGDFKGGPLSEDSAIVDKAFDLRDAAISLRDWWRDEAMPALEKFNVFLEETFRPTFEELAQITREDLVPAFREMQKVLEDNKPAVDAVLGVLGFLIVTLGVLRLKMLGDVLPPLINFAGFLVSTYATAVAGASQMMKDFGDLISGVFSWVGKVADRFDTFISTIKDMKVPGWIRDLAELTERIAGGVSTGAGKLAAFFGAGDGPGRAVRTPGAGGSTLSKVQGLLPAGAAVTSTYRSPGQNAAVGGVPGSYHTDVKNPAVDIGGTRAAMDETYARLAAIGGWRELLYKVPGHWDHVHVAHQGGVVSPTWPSMPGWGPNERPVRAQVGETILPAGARTGPSQVTNYWTLNEVTDARGTAMETVRIQEMRGRA